jgi:hypothetical protein
MRNGRRPGGLALDGRWSSLAALMLGLVALLVVAVGGLVGQAFDAIAAPAPVIRAVLAGSAIVAGLALLRGALLRIDRAQGGRPDGSRGGLSDADLGTMVRGVRFVFLAAAAFAAASGWLLAQPLPIVVALIIAGVDVVETSFLLLVATRRR